MSACSGEEISKCRGLGVVSGEDLGIAGLKAISSTRVVPPVEIVAATPPGLAGLVNWKTLSVLLPSPA